MLIKRVYTRLNNTKLSIEKSKVLLKEHDANKNNIDTLSEKLKMVKIKYKKEVYSIEKEPQAINFEIVKNGNNTNKNKSYANNYDILNAFRKNTHAIIKE